MARGEIKALLFADGVSVTAATEVQFGWTYDDATGWDGVATSVTYDLTNGTLLAASPNPPSDARKAQWFLKKPSGDNYEQVLAKITTPSATSVVVDAGDFVLAAGTYRLVGVY